MSTLSTLLQAVQVVSSLSIIGLVLLQQGKGADMGSSFGSGSAGSLFGSAGAANFLSRMTKWAAIVFFVSTAGLAWAAYPRVQAEGDSGLMQNFGSTVPGMNVPAEPKPAEDLTVPKGAAPNDVSAASTVPASKAVPATEEVVTGKELSPAERSDAEANDEGQVKKETATEAQSPEPEAQEQSSKVGTQADSEQPAIGTPSDDNDPKPENK